MGKSRECCKCFTVSLVPAASLILVVIFGVGVFLLPVLYTELAVKYNYGIILDAGSSHTKTFLYKWEVPTEDSKTGRVEQKWSCSGASLNSFAEHPANSPEAFTDCLRRANDSHKGIQELHKTIPVFLGATAGMRLLDKEVREEIIKDVRVALRHSGYKTGQPWEGARVISGKEEAASGWTTINYLKGNFYPEQKPTMGALDMGGASAEIAFIPSSPPDQNHTVEESVFGQTYKIYAHSYLCYGENEAYSRYLAQLVANNRNSTLNVKDSCLFKGANISVKASTVYSPCVNSSSALSVFGSLIYPPPSLAPDTPIVFTGTGNVTECKKVIKDIFNFTSCSNGSCVPYVGPPVNGSFVGYSGYYHNAKFFFNHSHLPVFTKESGFKTYDGNVTTKCSYDNKTATENLDHNNTYFYRACFRGAFILHLLQDGIGFHNTSAHNWSVQFLNKIGKVETGWAMGFLLNVTDTIPQTPYYDTHPYTLIDLVVGMVVLTILCTVFVLFFFLTFYACKKSLGKRGGYQNIP